ncbi:MAG: hypothetical protein JKX85_12930 [Phycisphaeraceae bacterium]|nr:hypothetical protein [Phycisphaeraceae bacterium]
MKQIPLSHGLLNFAGHISLEKTEHGIRPWRLKHSDLPLYHSQGLQGRASSPSGVRMNLLSDTNCLTVDAVPVVMLGPATRSEAWKMDLLVDGQLHQRVVTDNVIDQSNTFKFTDIPAGEHRLEIWLDVFQAVEIRQVSIDDNATAKSFNDTRPKWLVYGSSITHCGAAHGPSETWPALVDNEHGLNLTSLGFGGNCHLDPMVLRDMRGQPADIISTCVGINIQGGGSFSERSFIPHVIGMIKTLREGHPVTPLMVVSPISSPPREDVPNNVGMSLSDCRKQVRIAVQTVVQHDGDKHLYYHDGLELFGPQQAHHMPDELHPDGDGIHMLAKHYSEQVIPQLISDLHANVK